MSVYPPETTASLMKMREDWFRVVAIPNQHGGFDIALVIDGSYDRQYYDPADLVQLWTERIKAALAADGLPLGVPLSQCAGRAAVLGGEPMPALLPGPDPTLTPDPKEQT